MFEQNNELANALMAKKKKKIKVDGKEYDESEFDDSRSWSRAKKKVR